MNRYEEIGLKIKHARDNVGMSQKELASRIGYKSSTAISLIEAGERKVSIVDLEKIAEVFGQNIDTFLGHKEKEVNVSYALRASKELDKEDQDKIIDFIDFVKTRRNGR